MSRLSRSALCAAIAVLFAGIAPGLAAPVSSSNANPTADKPSQAKIPEGSGSSTEPLSEKLDRSGGVIHPQAIGSHSTPVIPPPGSPGGKSGVNPK
jgi:hypothetical protein